MGEADLARIEGRDTGGQSAHLLAGRDRPGGGVGGHPAVMADPVDRGHRALRVVLVGRREGRRAGRKPELEDIDAMPKPDQEVPELSGGSSSVGSWTKRSIAPTRVSRGVASAAAIHIPVV